MNNTHAYPSDRLPEGTVLEYQVWDENGHPVIRDLTRNQARELRRECGGYVVKAEVVH